jgi:predicted kinase
MSVVLVTGVQATGKSTMAEVAGEALGAPVLAHDWVMSGLRPFPELQRALDEMDPPGHGVVGWSLLWTLARAQLRRGSSVVLDGVARQPEVRGTREVAAEEGAACLVVMTTCADVDLHRSRVEGRSRGIPNWYELDWDHVARTRASWQAPAGVDLVLDAAETTAHNGARLRRALVSLGDLGRLGPVERYFESLSARDWPALAEVLAPDVERVGPLGDPVSGRVEYLGLLARSVPERYGNDVHQILYAPDRRSAFARVTEHLAYPDRDLHLEEAYAFTLDQAGLLTRVEVFWQSPPQQA